MLEIVKLKLTDEMDWDCVNVYYVVKDRKYQRNVKKLEEDICKNYETYQDIEDFIMDNFTIIDIYEKPIEF